MDIAVLGPLELRGPGGEVVPVAGARLRALLVLLALEPKKVVSAERLIDAVWGDEPPSAAGNALQALVSRLRRAGLVIEAAAYGYRLVIEPGQVDAHVFTELAASDPARALTYWRGDLDFPEVARAEAARLHELRLDATKRGLTGSEAVPTLEGLVTQHPLDEQLVGLLMRALRAAGNPGRALEVYEQARQRLAGVLGADPSAELRDLHLELLREERRSGNLPAEVSSFVGREADVSAVRDLLSTVRSGVS